MLSDLKILSERTEWSLATFLYQLLSFYVNVDELIDSSLLSSTDETFLKRKCIYREGKSTNIYHVLVFGSVKDCSSGWHYRNIVIMHTEIEVIRGSLCTVQEMSYATLYSNWSSSMDRTSIISKTFITNTSEASLMEIVPYENQGSFTNNRRRSLKRGVGLSNSKKTV